MGPRYYRPGENRVGMRIVPTRKFFMMVAAIAAIIVVIVLIVTLVPASEKEKTIADVTAEEATETVPATEEEYAITDEQTVPVEAVEESESVMAEETAEEMIVPETAEEETVEPVETKPAKTSYTMLKDGSTGEEVTNLQNRLIELGYLEAGNNTGKFGPMTEEAVKAFQTKNGLQADGMAGSATQALLFSDAAVAK